jgi:hypothetical protein
MQASYNSLADLLEKCANLVTIVSANKFLRGEVKNSFLLANCSLASAILFSNGCQPF